MAYADYDGKSIADLSEITDNVTECDETYWEGTAHAYGQIYDILAELGWMRSAGGTTGPSGSFSDVGTRLDHLHNLDHDGGSSGAGLGMAWQTPLRFGNSWLHYDYTNSVLRVTHGSTRPSAEVYGSIVMEG